MNKIQIVSTNPLVIKKPRVIPEKVEYDEINQESINQQIQNIDNRIAEIRKDCEDSVSALEAQKQAKIAELQIFDTQEIKDAVSEFEAEQTPIEN